MTKQKIDDGCDDFGQPIGGDPLDPSFWDMDNVVPFKPAPSSVRLATETEVAKTVKRPWNDLSIEDKIRRAAVTILAEDIGTEPEQFYPPPITSKQLAETVYPLIAWTIANLIREGVPQTLDGDAGIGKSNVAVGFVVGRTAGKTLWGKRTLQGPALYITHEDDEGDLQAMAQGYAGYLGVKLGDLPIEWWSLLEQDITLAIIDDKGGWKPGPFYAALKKKLTESPRGMFVVLDTRSDVVQMNEALREPPNTFYKTVLMPLCKQFDCTILVLCHPSKASMADGSFYSGGTGNKGALRNKLVLKLDDNDAPLGPRILDVLKRNRGTQQGVSVKLTYDPQREIFVSDNDAAVQKDQRATLDMVVSAVLELRGKSIRVTATGRGDGRGPKDVADYINRERKPATRMTKKTVATMLKLAIETGGLRYVEGKGHVKATYEGPDDFGA